MVTIPAQFNGPADSGNGGWVSGLLAREHGADVVTVTLRQPPPLDTPLTWERDDDEVRLVTAGGAIVGDARAGAFTADAPPASTAAEAEAGRAAYPGFRHHPFDRCFTCGTARDEGDGLRIFSGPVAEGRTAAAFTVHESFADADGTVDLPVTWAGLDCPGGWAADFTRQLMLLGRMTAQVLRPPRAGEPLVATGVLRAQERRKFLTSTAVHTLDGELVGRSEQVWISVAPGVAP